MWQMATRLDNVDLTSSKSEFSSLSSFRRFFFFLLLLADFFEIFSALRFRPETVIIVIIGKVLIRTKINPYILIWTDSEAF